MLPNLLKSLVLWNTLANIVNSELCGISKVDNMYTKHIYRKGGTDWYSIIAIVENNKLYLWDNEHQSVDKPIAENKNPRILTRVQIFELCDEDNIECKEVNKYQNLILTFSKDESTGNYSYRYSRALVDESDSEESITRWDLSFNQTVSGNPLETNWLCWLPEWVTDSHPCVAFDRWNKEFIYLFQNGSSDIIRVVRVEVLPLNIGRQVFTEQTINFSHQLVGLFNYRYGSELNKIYAITQDLKVFEFNETKSFKETTLNFKQLIGCQSDDESINWLPIIIVLAIVVTVILIVVFLLYVVWKKVFVPNYYKGTTKTKEKGESVTRRSDAGNTELTSIVTVDSTTGNPIRDQ